MTGASQPVAKTAQPLPDGDTPVADRRNTWPFMGTTITGGRGRMIVTATGMRTEERKIGTLLEGDHRQQSAASGEFRSSRL